MTSPGRTGKYTSDLSSLSTHGRCDFGTIVPLQHVKVKNKHAVLFSLKFDRKIEIFSVETQKQVLIRTSIANKTTNLSLVK